MAVRSALVGERVAGRAPTADVGRATTPVTTTIASARAHRFVNLTTEREQFAWHREGQRLKMRLANACEVWKRGSVLKERGSRPHCVSDAQDRFCLGSRASRRTVRGSTKHSPMLGGEVRPASWGNGDGSWIVGGPDGTGKDKKPGYPNLGHIQWTRWSSTRSDWLGCRLGSVPRRPRLSARIHPRRRHTGITRLVASDPYKGEFQHLQVGPGLGGFCVIYPPRARGNGARQVRYLEARLKRA